MTLLRLIFRSLIFYRRTGCIVAFGVAVAAAVITGSLLVGDSVSGSIRDTALARLGSIDSALIAPRYFNTALGDVIGKLPTVKTVAPALLTRGTVKNSDTEVALPNVNVIGSDARFWSCFPNSQPTNVSGRQVAVNAALARDLSVVQNDTIILTVERQGSVPADTLFARRKREDTLRILRLQVAAILPDAGVGSFALDAGTAVPRNLFIDLDWLRTALGTDGCNSLLVVNNPKYQPTTAAQLQFVLGSTCTLADYGLKLVPDATGRYLSVQSDSMLLNDAQTQAIQQAATEGKAKAELISVYLAARIASGQRSISYAIVAGVPSLPAGRLQLNNWAAADLGAKAGSPVTVTYLAPAWDGTYHEATARFTVSGISEMSPTDRGLTPDFDGITNADSIDKWNPPFPIDLHRVTPRDDEYWTRFHATPKAFVSLDAARSMWASGPAGARADWVTTVRLTPPAGTTLAAFQRQFTHRLLDHLTPESAGLAFRPVRTLALTAAKGTVDFGELFLSMSFFLVLAAAGLAGMLMRLMADRRAAEAGIMLANGFSPGVATLAVLGEGAVLTVIGTLLGVPLGVLYAMGIMHALTTWWVGAVGTSALWLHITHSSLIAGCCAGLVVGLLSVAWGAARLGRGRVLELLAGWQAMDMRPAGKRLVVPILFAAMLAAAGALIALALLHCIPAQGAFFGGGAALLVAGLCVCHLTLTRALTARNSSASFAGLALRSAAANRGRSLLIIGLLASATFIIVAVAANTRDLSHTDVARRDSGAGGFTLRAITALPVTYDLGSPTGRQHLGFSPDDEAVFTDVQIIPFLLSPGEDISCLNLARPSYPRVLGVRQEMIARGGFTLFTQDRAAKWAALQSTSKTIPAFCDADSAEWTLHTGLGKPYGMPGEGGKPVNLHIAGLFASSVFASELLVSEAQFRGIFPSVSAPRYFLITTPPGREKQVADALRRNLGDYGVEVRSTAEVLNGFMRVQNTYLSTFLALGGLGVLLGTIGMIIVLLRNALERRREFAVMLATGFSQPDLSRLLIIENTGFLLTGLLCGAVCALIAVAPQLVSVEAQVNWMQLAILLVAIFVLGLLSCTAAAHAATRGRLIEALREE